MMVPMKYLYFLLLLISACSTTEQPVAADAIIKNAITAHGLTSIQDKKIEFDFRNRHYSLLRTDNNYTYTRSFQDSLGFVEDILINSSKFTRLVNGNVLHVDSIWSGKYSNSVNSVLYFIQLPLTLMDLAAMKKYKGLATIKGKNYHLIEVRFEEENGGVDFQDVFLYWFNTETFTMDFFAYSYITDGGGVRFREAINTKRVDGIIFQDYINYQPKDKNTPLNEMATLFEADQLVELSKIENTNITVN